MRKHISVIEQGMHKKYKMKVCFHVQNEMKTYFHFGFCTHSTFYNENMFSVHILYAKNVFRFCIFETTFITMKIILLYVETQTITKS